MKPSEQSCSSFLLMGSDRANPLSKLTIFTFFSDTQMVGGYVKHTLLHQYS